MDTSKMRGLTLSIYKHDGRDWSNGGVSSKHDEVVLIGMIHAGNRNDVTPFPESSRVPRAAAEDRPAVVLVRRVVGGQVMFHVEPLHRPDGMIGFMTGGTYVATSDSRMRDLDPNLPYGALAFHDRLETPAQYAALSD